MNRLIIVDLDQTLLDSPRQKVPSEAFVRCAQEIFPDICVGFATGRAYSWALPVLKAGNFTAPCIIGGGAIIVNPQTYEVTSSISLHTGDLDSIKSILLRYPDTKLLFGDYTDDDYLSGGWDLDEFLASSSCEIVDIIGLSHERADEIILQLQQLQNIHAVKMNGYNKEFVDILVTHKRATKTYAIKALQAEFNISIANTIGIGNGYNDIEIFDAVGTKVAVANAVDELKQSADTIIGDVSTDPIPSYINQLKFS
jgi:HAD superfamily hydrolase (TIGR01484 family)